MKSVDLPIPVYLNQQIVFDLLAILEDGFSQFSTLRTSMAESEKREYGAESSIGASNVFALLGISFSGRQSKGKGTQEQREMSQKKIHTPTSLFAKLRQLLRTEGLIVDVVKEAPFDKLEAGQFIEFRAVLRKNPLLEMAEMAQTLMKFLAGFPTDKSAKTRSGRGGGKARATQSIREAEQLKAVLDALTGALTDSGSVELVGELLDVEGARVVITSNISFFSHRSALEIIDGEFYILGKIVRVIDSGENGAINLLRKTAFGALGMTMLDDMLRAFEQIRESGINVSEMVVEVPPPAILVVPIAIFT